MNCCYENPADNYLFDTYISEHFVTGYENYNFQENYEEEVKKEIFTEDLVRREHAVNRLKEVLHKHSMSTTGRPRHTLRHLLHNREVAHAAGQAHVHPRTLQAVLSSPRETQLFVNNQKTLEDFDPEFYVENYGFFQTLRKIGNKIETSVVAIASKISESVKKAFSSFIEKAKSVIATIKTSVGAAIDSGYSKLVSSYQAILAGYDFAKNKIVQSDFWNWLKEILKTAKDLLWDFAQGQFFQVLAAYIKCDTCRKIPSDANVFDANVCTEKKLLFNDAKLSEFLLEKLKDFVTTAISAVPGAGGVFMTFINLPGISTIIDNVVSDAWDEYIWTPIKDVVKNKILDPFMKANYATWTYEMAEFYNFLIMKENFENKLEHGGHLFDFKDHVSKCVDECRGNYMRKIRNLPQTSRHLNHLPTHIPVNCEGYDYNNAYNYDYNCNYTC